VTVALAPMESDGIHVEDAFDAAVLTPNASSAKPAKRQKVDQDFLLVGFQGKEGAFSDVAARLYFDELKRHRALTPNDFETVGYSQVATVVDALERGEIEYAVLPIENSISGTFHGILDRLIASELKIVGEIACVQELCLCAVEGAKIEDLNCLLSHPAILDHCQAYITDLEKKYGMYIDRQATWDSAGACHMVRHEGHKTIAAIASEQAALTHGLCVLEKGVGDELHNETRYAILARRENPALVTPAASAASRSVKMKSSIVVAVPNEPQALFKIVSAFALRNVTIIKIESRPASTAGGLFSSQTHHWYVLWGWWCREVDAESLAVCGFCRDYIFFIDYVVRCVAIEALRHLAGLTIVGFDGFRSPDAAVNERLLRHLEEFALWIKDLGTYASSAVKTNVEPPRWKTLCNVMSC
jgi:prephenate dehydratase